MICTENAKLTIEHQTLVDENRRLKELAVQMLLQVQALKERRNRDASAVR